MSSSRFRILLIEDDLSFQERVRSVLRSVGDVISAPSLARAKDLLRMEPFDLCLLDYRLPDGLALDLLTELRGFPDHGPVIFISANSDPRIIERCLNLGAVDFIPKSSNYETDLLSRIPLAIQRAQHLRRYSELSKRYEEAFQHELLGESEAVKALKEQINVLKGERINSVLILGPDGSGKELVARRLHKIEGKGRPFLAVSAGSITDSTFESELFGHDKGAFAHADQTRLGLVELAHSGDLFIDEISDLTILSQRKLLRFLAHHEFVPVGGTRVKKVSVRILCSSSRNLMDAIKKGQFLIGLYHAISDHCIQVPSLAERTEDIPILAQFFLDRLTNKAYTLNDEVFAFLKEIEWPGNVRELEQAIRGAYLQAKIRGSSSLEIQDFQRNPFCVETGLKLPSQPSQINKESYRNFVYNAEKMYWREALRLFQGNASRLSQASGIGLSTINNKIRDFSLRARGKLGGP